MFWCSTQFKYSLVQTIILKRFPGFYPIVIFCDSIGKQQHRQDKTADYPNKKLTNR